jgi:hypothetical protein
MARDEPTNVAGLAACLALLEIEARALGQPLAAHLIAAAGAALMEGERARRAPSEEKAAKRLYPIAGE